MTDNRLTVVKPCPCCRCKAKLYPLEQELTAYVECENCHLNVHGLTDKHALARWNTRL
jgi:hypothetical protein